MGALICYEMKLRNHNVYNNYLLPSVVFKIYSDELFDVNLHNRTESRNLPESIVDFCPVV